MEKKAYYFIQVTAEECASGWKKLTEQERNAIAGLYDFDIECERGSWVATVNVSDMGIPSEYVEKTNEFAKNRGLLSGNLWNEMHEVDTVDPDWLLEQLLKDFDDFELDYLERENSISDQEVDECVDFFTKVFDSVKVSENFVDRVEKAKDFLHAITAEREQEQCFEL